VEYKIKTEKLNGKWITEKTLGNQVKFDCFEHDNESKVMGRQN